MKLLIQSAMIFFGTLMAAGVVALGEPAGARLAMKAKPAAPAPAVARLTQDDTAARQPR
jgi:hypothetical protein